MARMASVYYPTEVQKLKAQILAEDEALTVSALIGVLLERTWIAMYGENASPFAVRGRFGDAMNKQVRRADGKKRSIR